MQLVAGGLRFGIDDDVHVARAQAPDAAASLTNTSREIGLRKLRAVSTSFASSDDFRMSLQTLIEFWIQRLPSSALQRFRAGLDSAHSATRSRMPSPSQTARSTSPLD